MRDRLVAFSKLPQAYLRVGLLLLSISLLGVGCDGSGQQQARANAEIDSFRQGERLFRRYCQHCHQPHGRGVPGTFPPLASSEILQGPVAIPIAIVLLGLQGPIEREGLAYNGVMPGLAERMDDGEIAAALSYLRQKWGAIEEPVATETVTQMRTLLGERRSLWTEPELLRAFR